MKSGENDLQPSEGILFLVGTPIGNLEDISPRSRRVLTEVEVIFAEDTRKTRVLLSHLEIFSKQLNRYSESDRVKATDWVISFLARGANVALVTDAGMPSISDPGSHLVRACVEAGFKVVVVPGPTAESAAVALSGAVEGPYLFCGFMRPVRRWLETYAASAADVAAALVGYVAPHDVAKVLIHLGDVIGEQANVVVCREMTKVFEERIEGPIDQLLLHRRIEDPKGEYVIVVPASSLVAAVSAPGSDLIFAVIASCLDRHATRSDRARTIASLTGVPRSEIYESLGD